MLVALAVCVAGFLVAFLATAPLVRLADERGFGLDFQDEFRKRHDGRVSRLGGIPIVAGFAVVVGIVSLAGDLGPRWPVILCTSALIFLLGLRDDFRPLGARIKLLGQVSVAVTAYLAGLQIETLSSPSGRFIMDLGTWGFFATVLWLVAVPNMMNLIDGFDGLAAGIGVLLSVTLGVVAVLSEQWDVAWIAFGLGGSLMGFLFFNFPPAKIFLGDGGAYFIGFVVAAMSLASENKGSVAAALLVTFVALGVPIIDTTLAIGRRALQGFPVWRGDRGHIHHRLQRLGFSKHRIVLGLYAVCVLLSLVGLSIFWSQGRTLPIAAGVLIVLAVYAVRFVGSVNSFQELQSRCAYALRRRRDVQYALLQGKILELEVDRVADGREFWRLFLDTLRRCGISQAPEGAGEVRTAKLVVPGMASLALFADAAIESQDYMERLTECFRPSFDKAVLRWPDDAPGRRRLMAESEVLAAGS
jgi:UDP-GlcNAc:undecaprenyl-phosphate GlcNAc-1-phosphate transferase